MITLNSHQTLGHVWCEFCYMCRKEVIMNKYGLELYEWQENIINPAILKGEEITYAVLLMIMNNKSRKVFTDHKRIIICHSWEGMPVWVWTADDVTNDELKKVAECLSDEFSLSEGYTYNISYELLEKLKSINDEISRTKIKVNMLSYRCDKVNDIEKNCGGKSRLAEINELEEICKLISEFEYEAAGKRPDEEQVRNSVVEKIEARTLYVWEYKDGDIVSTTNIRIGDGVDTLATVYTKPEARRKGYCLNLVHDVTKTILDKGRLPILYTNADYEASNACYKKVGFRKVGSLCEVQLAI